MRDRIAALVRYRRRELLEGLFCGLVVFDLFLTLWRAK